MSKLDGGVVHALAVWRAELEYAESGDYPDLDRDLIQHRRVPVLVTYRGDPDELRAAGLDTGFDQGGFVSGQIDLVDIERLESVPGVVAIELVRTDTVDLDTSVQELRVPWKVPPPDPWPGKGAGVIVAVIDTGIDVFHESFQKADGTPRILELWDQSNGLAGGSLPPSPLQQIGKIYKTEEIKAGIDNGSFPSVDDRGHGTHVAGIAAGNGRQDDRCSFPGRYIGVAPEADLIVVKAIGLPPGSTANVLDALQWCFDATTRHSKPVVINCSFSNATGPHDGTSPRDRWIDRLVRPSGIIRSGVAIVTSAGNNGARDIHESGVIPANGSVTIPFYMPDDSRRPDELDIWYSGAATLSVTLTAPPNPAVPGPHVVGPIGPGPSSTVRLGRMRITVDNQLFPNAFNGKKNINITIAAPPPPPPPPQPPLFMRSGTWQLTLTETGGMDASWDAWFEPSKTDGYPEFRFPGDPPAPIPRRAENTIGDPGTGRSVITVANYDDGNGELAIRARRVGPFADPGRDARRRGQAHDRRPRYRCRRGTRPRRSEDPVVVLRPARDRQDRDQHGLSTHRRCRGADAREEQEPQLRAGPRPLAALDPGHRHTGG